MMRYSQGERMEIIRLVEQSELSISQTLGELGVPQSTFYRWYRRYQEAGYDGLADHKSGPRQFWNRIPDEVREQVVEIALGQPEQSPRELAWSITDHEGYFISESSVYRILKANDLVTSPAFRLVSASDRFENPTRRVNEMWQTDFTQLKVVSWGWYYLCSVLDDFSRYILAWRLAPPMATSDVKATPDQALAATDVPQVKVEHRPRLLSDNGPSFVSKPLCDYLQTHKIEHIRGAPYHPMTQGKIERYHRSMKNIVKLDTFYFPWDLEAAVAAFVDYYNHQRYHEALDNLTPADVYFGRAEEVKSRRAEIKQKTLQERRNLNLQIASHSV
jgi:putative transposase